MEPTNELAEIIEAQAKKIRRLEAENQRLKRNRKNKINLTIYKGGYHHGKSKKTTDQSRTDI